MPSLPHEFRNTIISVHGKAGEEWLVGFDELIKYCTNKWRFKLLPFKKLSYNFVAAAVFEDGSKSILKLGVPGAGLLSEMAAIKAFDGNSFCKLLDAEPEKGIMLLECIEPGEPLNIIRDEIASTKIAASLIKDMQLANPISGYSFQTADEWYQDLLNLYQRFGDDQLPYHIFKSAIAAYQLIKSDQQEQRILHGDLHHENILSAGNDTWKAIDPKGIIAETSCELIPFLMNNLEAKDTAATISQRINIFSDQLKIDKKRIIRWGAFRSALSTYWKIEDGMPITREDLMICEYFSSNQL